ncbi:BTAD domain-containing putative transcriptional regulator [Micromonospora sp. NPDC057141]
MLPAAKPQLILAMLSMYAGTVLQTHQLVDELWGERPPPSATRTVQTYVYHLRRRFTLGGNRDAGEPGRSLLLTRTGGYELRFGEPTVLDSARFTLLVNQAREQVSRNHLADAAKSLRAGLDLWRGEPFAGLRSGPELSAARVRLGQARMSAIELRLDLELQLGRHRELLDDLPSLVLGAPANEGFSKCLMIALHRCGRRTEALEVYHRLRHHLREEFGVLPSPAVQQVFQDVLNDEVLQADSPRRSALTLSQPGHNQLVLPPRPALLGRDREMRRLHGALSQRGLQQLRTVEVTGGPGEGTTSFAVHAAHEFRSEYRDGAVFVDLRGIVEDEPNVARLLSERLSDAGVQLDEVDDLDELSWAFRTWSRNRSILLVADHVFSTRVLAAVRPSGPDSAMIAVNHSGTPGLVGDVLIELGPLSADVALTLLTSITGPGCVRQQPEAAARLIELCDGNSLALCAAARLLACRQDVQASRVVRDLEGDPKRLIRLWWAGRTVEDSIRDRLRHLPADATAALAALGESNPSSRPVRAGLLTAMLEWEPNRVEFGLDKLADAQLIEEVSDGTEEGHRAASRPLARAFRVRPLILLSMAAQP